MKRVSLTIDSEMENMVKFYSFCGAGLSLVQYIVLRGQVLNLQRPHVGHTDPLVVLVLEPDPGWRICPRMDFQ